MSGQYVSQTTSASTKKKNEMGRVEEKEKKTVERRYRFSIQKDFVFHSQEK